MYLYPFPISSLQICPSVINFLCFNVFMEVGNQHLILNELFLISCLPQFHSSLCQRGSYPKQHHFVTLQLPATQWFKNLLMVGQGRNSTHKPPAFSFFFLLVCILPYHRECIKITEIIKRLEDMPRLATVAPSPITLLFSRCPTIIK